MSPTKATLRLLCGAWTLAAVAGCGSTQPTPVADVYALQTLNESALPYDHGGLGCCTYLNGELQLLEGRYAASLTARNRNTGVVFTAIEWGKYTDQFSTLKFVADSFRVAPLGLDVGVPDGGGLRVAFGGEGPGSADQFHAWFVKSP
jgi:hypothetical protein